MVKPDRRVFPFLPALLFGMLALLQHRPWRVILPGNQAPVVKDGAVYELGVVFASLAAQLQQNDVVTFRLPSDFIWTAAELKSDENTAAAETRRRPGGMK